MSALVVKTAELRGTAAHTTLLAGSILACGVLCGVLCGFWSCASYGPIPSACRITPVQAMEGSPWQGELVDVPLQIEEHPWLAPQGVNGMHDDSWGTNTVPWSGPRGIDPLVQTMSPALAGGELATLCFDRKGRIIGISGQFDRFVLYLLDPLTLQPLASTDLPQRPSMKEYFRTFNYDVIMKDTSGGGYFHLGVGDQPIVACADRHIRYFALDESNPDKLQWTVVRDLDINPYLEPGDTITDACPDWDGLLWFTTRRGVVGTLDVRNTPASTQPAVRTLTMGEGIQNSFSVARDGVYIVTDHALYRFSADPHNQSPLVSWREDYDRGTGIKPGHIDQGSGTTPTLFGTDLVAITDNHDLQDRLLVYHRLPDWTGSRLVCTVALFDPGHSSSENSITAWGNSLFVENNWQYGKGHPTDPDPRSHPGIVRVDVDANSGSGRIVWESREASPTVVPKLSANGLLYVYTRDRIAPGEPSTGQATAWFLTALDAATGKTVFRIHTGNGPGYNNNYAPISIGPDGTAYIGCFNGLIAVRDRAEKTSIIPPGLSE